MTVFAFEVLSAFDVSDRAMVGVDGTYHVVIIRTEEGLIVDVYPRDGDCPVASTWVHDNDVREQEDETD
jgi:hypothetical protein